VWPSTPGTGARKNTEVCVGYCALVLVVVIAVAAAIAQHTA
jgi:hypothetical protein